MILPFISNKLWNLEVYFRMIVQYPHIIRFVVYSAVVCFVLSMESKVEAANIANEEGPYWIKNQSDYCFLMQFKVHLELPYIKKDDTIGSQSFDDLTLTRSAGSICKENTTILVLNGKPSKAQSDWTITFEFVKSDVSKGSNGKFQASQIKVEYRTDSQVFPDAKGQELMTVQSNDVWGKTDLGSFYHCMAPQTTELNGNGKKGKIRLSDIKLQAFMSAKEAKFSDKESLCAADQTPDNTVPIAVGIALAVCIVIALIVFVIFNRRNRRNYGTV